ncbi:NADP-dependent phosphogluconate dehydrogenase [Thioclava sp. BHET1]|nr:NADP-dependent phosphogluconate dehydrogenase [Thioclava sp. BHET1]
MSKAEIGLVGLGTMGAMLSLNIAEKGFPIAVWNMEPEVTDVFVRDAGDLADKITPAKTLEDFVAAIAVPRSIILMIPAGAPVDEMIGKLKPLLDKDDLLIDAGNADFHDSNRHAEEAARDGFRFLGIGVSGGSEGARNGPSIMGGGEKSDWDRVAHILRAISAKYEGTPCATYMGPGGAGHFVKAVHNGIEYADMQMIAEVYGVLRDGMGMSAAEIAKVFARWNDGPLQSYLIEIAAKVASAADPHSDKPILDMILDAAGQKGTGRWTVIEAQHLGAPVSVIEAAVAARNLSSRVSERAAGEDIFGAAPKRLAPGALSIDTLEQALIAGKILCYAQGFEMIATAARKFDWPLPLPEIAEVWREGCIIRSAMLNDMASALKATPDQNLMFAAYFAEHLKTSQQSLREAVAVAALNGLPMPALSSGLAYFDIMRTARSTANMIQGLRDFFGAHGFDRIDGQDIHHGPWNKRG